MSDANYIGELISEQRHQRAVLGDTQNEVKCNYIMDQAARRDHFIMVSIQIAKTFLSAIIARFSTQQFARFSLLSKASPLTPAPKSLVVDRNRKKRSNNSEATKSDAR